MARFSVGGSEGEEDRDSNKNKRPVSENTQTSTNGGYQDKDEQGSSEDEQVYRRSRLSLIFTKKPRFSTPTSAACATTSAAPQQKTKRGFSELFLAEGESMEETEEETLESSDEEEETDEQLSVILSDPDVLDCPICLEPLTLPVFQCENGHIACAPCCTKMLNRCGSCCLPIGYNRCRAIEKVVESVKISCRNADYGCKETIRYSKKLDHENACIYVPCSCPYLACDYVDSSECMYTHFELNHGNCSMRFYFNLIVPISLDKNQKQLFLQEMTGGTLFILNRSIDRHGSLFNVVCIGPTSAKRRYSYTLMSKDGESSIKLETVADNMPKWIAHRPVKKYLLVPNDFIDSSGKLELEVSIWRSYESPVGSS
ncbi:E3 ubiquitin-protein ligase [Forsythia ovata]|uniref:RING-type E3 ubiquitin transferase n=1 Tax=Forsythia ovata TaxID=205694 RepID=A0ABD1P0X7_9LAMI